MTDRPYRQTGEGIEDEIAAGAVTNVAQYLEGIDFPASKRDVERVARENGADESAIEEIQALPDDRRYENPVDLFDAFGDEVREAHRAAEGQGR